jgi:hypothetical protein
MCCFCVSLLHSPSSTRTWPAGRGFFVNCVSSLKAVVRVASGDSGGAGGARLDSVCLWPGSCVQLGQNENVI